MESQIGKIDPLFEKAKYFYMYMPCKIKYTVAGDECRETYGCDTKDLESVLNHENVGRIISNRFCWNEKLILRPMSDMTEAEKSQLWMIHNKLTKSAEEEIRLDAEATKYLISIKVDVFGLIGSIALPPHPLQS